MSFIEKEQSLSENEVIFLRNFVEKRMNRKLPLTISKIKKYSKYILENSTSNSIESELDKLLVSSILDRLGDSSNTIQ